MLHPSCRPVVDRSCPGGGDQQVRSAARRSRRPPPSQSRLWVQSRLRVLACRNVVVNGKIATPQVTATAAETFNCPSAQGAPLENNGVSSTRGSHWEATSFAGELMIGTAGARRGILSNMTLALAEDSGWYYSNWENAGFLRYAHNSGCSLLLVRPLALARFLTSRLTPGSDPAPGSGTSRWLCYPGVCTSAAVWACYFASRQSLRMPLCPQSVLGVLGCPARR